MKTACTITVVALLCAAPSLTSACELDDSTAAVTPPTQLGLAAGPAASKAPVQKSAKATIARSRQAAAQEKAAATDTRVAATASASPR